MKIDRLLGILNILSQTDKITAPELAQRFEVSRRTINRDIEDICKAGIPIVTRQGSGGGIYIQEGYKIDKSLIKSHEMRDIVTALKGLGSISRDGNVQALLNKLVSKDEESDIISIDLSSFYKGSLSTKIDTLKQAIIDYRIVKFAYFSKAGEYKRAIEPYKIVYKWSDWYVHGYCLYKNDFRMFKLNRLWDLAITDDVFEKREVPQAKQDFGSHLTDEHEYEAIFDSSVKYLLVEAYGPDCFHETDDGRLHFKGAYTNKDYIVSWILGYGDKVQVVFPKDLVDEIKHTAKTISEKYVGT